MSYYAVWIDHKDAQIFKFSEKGIEKSKVNGEHDGGVDKFYHHVAQEIKDAKELMLMGPGTAKSEFKHHLENHHHANLAKAVVGVETVPSHPTDAMLMEKSVKFFTQHHLWTKNY